MNDFQRISFWASIAFFVLIMGGAYLIRPYIFEGNICVPLQYIILFFALIGLSGTITAINFLKN